MCARVTKREISNPFVLLQYQIETNKFYAVKIINKKLMEGREHMIRNEINILRKVSQGHKNILSLVDYFETLNNCT